jgi:hypothetical protein
MESGVEFTAVDFPQANRLTVHVLAAVAEHEREMISKRTKDAVARKREWYTGLTDEQRAELRTKGKATQLGGNRSNLPTVGDKGREISRTVRIAKANDRLSLVAPIIREIRASGVTLLRQIAAALNERASLPRAVPSGRLRRSSACWSHHNLTLSAGSAYTPAPADIAEEDLALLFCPEQGGWHTAYFCEGQWVDYATLSKELTPTHWLPIPPDPGERMTQDLTDWQKTVYDAVLWFAEELRQCDPKVVLPYYVEQIVMTAETARENEHIIPGDGREGH